MSYLLDQAEEALARAASKAERLRREYNTAAGEWKAAKARVDKLKFMQMETEIQLAHERSVALANGDHQLAALLVSKPPALR